jgi:hypothetical protein
MRSPSMAAIVSVRSGAICCFCSGVKTFPMTRALMRSIGASQELVMNSSSPPPPGLRGIARTCHLVMAGSGHHGAVLEQSGAGGGRGGRGARGHAQLHQDVGHVAMHGVRADHQALGDLRVAEAVRDQAEYLPLPGAELT